MSKAVKKEVLSYNTNLRAEIETDVNENPRARVHSVEWRKIMEGEPVEINPSIGHGYKIMTVDEWAGRWKRNDDFPECLNCNSKNTKEHHFTQVKMHIITFIIVASDKQWKFNARSIRNSCPDNMHKEELPLDGLGLCRRGVGVRKRGRASSCAWTATTLPGGPTGTRTSNCQRSMKGRSGQPWLLGSPSMGYPSLRRGLEVEK